MKHILFYTLHIRIHRIDHDCFRYQLCSGGTAATAASTAVGAIPTAKEEYANAISAAAGSNPTATVTGGHAGFISGDEEVVGRTGAILCDPFLGPDAPMYHNHQLSAVSRAS